uniref:Uncharacterized protein n=1 Tax=Candidatus Kentrum sp. LFY TaxID=2126342 RepID=A0A450U7Y2_9GAMM|nr:MAG: hypothetical protein BECKLFY1418B_GA0070995_100844 [Candidatus Kentron sp. LFY]
MIAWADPGPRSKLFRSAKGIHIVANLHEQHSRSHFVDAGDRLQRLKNRLVWIESAQHLPGKNCDTSFQLLNMVQRLGEHKDMIGRRLAGQGIKKLLFGLSRLCLTLMKRGSITPENERFLTAFEMTCFLSSRSEARDLVTLFGMYFHSNNKGLSQISVMLFVIALMPFSSEFMFSSEFTIENGAKTSNR